MTGEIGIAVIGFGWMGQVHSRAYARVRHHYPDLPPPVPLVVADAEADRRADAISRFGFAKATADWRDVLDDDRVGAVSVTAPNHLHREIGCAVAAAGKHLWIEKPVGIDLADAVAVAGAVATAGVRSAVGFNYRNAPAVERARDLVAAGVIGRVTNVRINLLADYAAHPQGVLSWRFERTKGGSGVLADLGSHGVDLARFLCGEIDSLVADTATFIDRRPIPAGTTGHYAIGGSADLGRVGNEDYVNCLMRFSGGARGSIEASRVSVGDQCTYGFEVHGTQGALRWDFRRMGELIVNSGGDYLDQPSSTVFVDPGHGDLGAFQPAAGISMSYDDLKVIEAHRFLRSIADGKTYGATVTDAVASALVIEAMEQSVRDRRWVTLRHGMSGVASGRAEPVVA